MALIHIRRRVPYPVAAFSAFLASTFGNNIGFAILTGTSIRYRVYSQIGLSALNIAGVSSMCALTTMFGMSSIFGIAMPLQGTIAPGPKAYCWVQFFLPASHWKGCGISSNRRFAITQGSESTH